MEDRRVTTGHRSDVIRVGQVDERAYPGNPDSEQIAVAPVAGVHEADRIQPDQPGLQ
jgi:hypothetical protein